MAIDYQIESWLAWVSHDESSALRRVVKMLLDSTDGLTCDEIEVITGISHQTCSATITHASRRGLLIKSSLRRPTRTGRLARVYQLAEKPEVKDEQPAVIGTVATKQLAEAARGLGEESRSELAVPGLDKHLPPPAFSDQEQRKIADIYRRSRERQVPDGSVPHCGDLFA